MEISKLPEIQGKLSMRKQCVPHTRLLFLLPCMRDWKQGQVCYRIASHQCGIHSMLGSQLGTGLSAKPPVTGNPHNGNTRIIQYALHITSLTWPTIFFAIYSCSFSSAAVQKFCMGLRKVKDLRMGLFKSKFRIWYRSDTTSQNMRPFLDRLVKGDVLMMSEQQFSLILSSTELQSSRTEVSAAENQLVSMCSLSCLNSG